MAENKALMHQEALHASLICAEMFDRYVAEHPAVTHNRDLADEAAQICERLNEFYQKLGAICADA